MVNPTYEVMIDLNNDTVFGDANEDISADLIQMEYVIGRDFASMLTGRSRGGRAFITLDNDTNNGKYNSFNTSSPLFGNLLPGRRVRIRAGQWALGFDGLTGNVDFGSPAALDDLQAGGGTFEAWIKADSDGENNAGYIFFKGTWHIRVQEESGGAMKINIQANFSTANGIWSTTDRVITVGVWHHVAVVYSNSSPTGNPLIYVDGVARAVSEIATPSGTRSDDSASNLLVGNISTDDRTFDGQLDDFRAWSDVRSTSEIANNRNVRLTGAEAGLAGYWPVDTGEGSVIDDETSNNNDGTAISHTWVATQHGTGPAEVVQWQGFLDRINPQVSVTAQNTALLEAVGPLAWLSRADFELFLPILTDQTTGAVLDDLLDAVSWPAGDRDIDTGKSTIRQFYFNSSGVFGTRERQVGFLNAAHKVEETELGFLHESRDAKIIFEDRDRRLQAPHTVVQQTFTDAVSATDVSYSRITQGDPLNQIFNLFITSIQNFTVGAIQVIWTHPEAVISGADIPTLEAGESIIMIASPDPQSAFDVVSLWTTPVATTDYLTNSQADGAGTNLTADVGVSVIKTGLTMVTTFTNNHASTKMFFTFLQARGQPLNLDNPVLVLAQDLTSQGKFGIRKFPVPAELVRDSVEGQDHVDALLSVYADPRPQLDLTVIGTLNLVNLGAVLGRRISDRVQIVANGAQSDLGINDPFFIESMRHRVIPGRLHTCLFSNSSVESVEHYWALDVGELGITTAIFF